MGPADALLDVDYLGINAAGKRSMYYVVIPNKYYNKLSCHILHCTVLTI